MVSISQRQTAQLAALIKAAGRVAVLGHTHPDGDALGSTSALGLYLQEVCGKEVACVFPDSPADNLRFILPPQLRILCLDQAPEQTAAWVSGAQLVFLVDANAFSRTEGLAPLLEASTAPKVLIDHHLNPDKEHFQLVFSTPDISSASELLYWILKALKDAPSSADMSIGTALLTGMTTDTNNFANSVFPSTLQMASELLELGVNRDAVLENIYQRYRENRVRVMGHMQAHELHVVPGGGAYMILTAAIQQRFDLREGETEGLVNVPLSIGDVRLSVLLKEEKDHFRVSVRSKKGTSAQQLAQRFFHGGGHENAAGGKLFIGTDIASAADAPAFLEQVLKTFLS